MLLDFVFGVPGDDDAVEGNTGCDTIFGGAGADSIDGGAGADSIDGGAGADSRAGAAGSDSSIVDTASDVISELAGEGFDRVYASVSTSLADNTERLILTASFRTGAGNADDNTLAGTAGSDTLNGGVGADFMTPGNGDDTYDVDNGFDCVTATNPGGVDAISSSSNLSLAANVEHLVLTGGRPDWYRQQRRQPDHRDWL